MSFPERERLRFFFCTNSIILMILFRIILLVVVVVANNHPDDEQYQHQATTKPNFIFFFPDTLRAESVYHDNDNADNADAKLLNITPHLDSLAQNGTTFTQAHAMHTQCSASRCTMMTGRYMHVLGHRTQCHLLQAYEENYFRLLKETAGYHIAWFGKNDVFSPASFNLSVNEWQHDDTTTTTIGYDSGKNVYEFGQAGYYSFLNTGGSDMLYNDTRNGDTMAVTNAAEFLRRNNLPEPFVIFIATRGAHPPYGAPKGFHDNLDMKQVKKAVHLRPPSPNNNNNNDNKPKYLEDIRRYRNLTTLSTDILYRIHKSYLEMIQYTDWTLGVLLDAVKENPELERRTTVFASSDHGDYAGDYGIVEKWPGGGDDVLTRVPLIAKIPGGIANHTVDHPVQIADILETMLDMANVTAPEYIRFGQSLLPALIHNDGEDVTPPSGGNDAAGRFVYAEGGFSFHSELFPGGSDHIPVNQQPRNMYWPRAQQEMDEGSPKWVMVRNATAKLVYRPTGDRSELYDLVLDPRELHNQFGNKSYADLQLELTNHMTNWLIQTGDVSPVRKDGRGLPSCPSPITWESCDALLHPDPSSSSSQAHPSDDDIMATDES